MESQVSNQGTVSPKLSYNAQVDEIMNQVRHAGSAVQSSSKKSFLKEFQTDQAGDKLRSRTPKMNKILA